MKPAIRQTATRLLTLATAAIVSLQVHAQRPTAPPSSEPVDFLKAPPKPASIRGRFRLVTIGDLLYSHPMANSADPKFQQVVELIRSGDGSAIRKARCST